MELKNESRKRTLYLLQHYKYVFDANQKKNPSQRLIKGECLVAKCFQHCVSAIYLSDGVMMPVIAERRFSDVGTLSVTARAALESLLAFGYIFYLPLGDEELRLRYNCWELSGLLDRRHLSPSWPLSEAHKNQLLKDEMEIEELKKNILVNPVFDKSKQDQVFEERKWRTKGWEKIGVELGFDKDWIKTIYGYLCSQAHSGGLSGIQMDHALINNDVSQPTGLIEGTIPVVLSHMIILLTKMSAISKEEHESNNTAIAYVDEYMKFSCGKNRK